MKINSIEQQAQDLHKKGCSIRQIATVLEIDKSRVQRILKKLHDDTYNLCDTDEVTPCNTAGGEGDTLCDTVHDTPYDTTSSASDTITRRNGDTPPDPYRNEQNDTNLDTPQIIFTHDTYSVADTRRLVRQAGMLQEDINEFVSYIVDIHRSSSDYMMSGYISLSRRSQRLIQSTKIIANQLGLDHENLLVIEVLHSIHATMDDIISNGQKNKYSLGTFLSIKPQDVRIWQNSMEVDLLHPLT